MKHENSRSHSSPESFNWNEGGRAASSLSANSRELYLKRCLCYQTVVLHDRLEFCSDVVDQ